MDHPGIARRLIEVLANGATLDEAAIELRYSRRIVNRRLKAIRDRLGVSTTSEALRMIHGRSHEQGPRA